MCIVGVDFPPGKVLRTFPSKAQVTFQVGLKHFKEVTANDFFIGIHYKDLLRNKEERVPPFCTDILALCQSGACHPFFCGLSDRRTASYGNT